MLKHLQKELQALDDKGLLRTLKNISKVTGNKIIINGKEYLNFCSNNYLGLADHPLVKEKAKKAIDDFGFGSGASRLISGTTILHQDLEAKLATFKHREACLVFTSGYQANIGIISSLAGEEDTIIIDRLNHASIIDACKFSKAKLQVYPHKDMEALKKVLQRSERFDKRLIITDSVFSMDGDISPIPEILKLAKKYHALVMVDEAHSTGVLGKTGRGIEEHFGIKGEIDILMGTLSKALGSLGGFVCGSKPLIDYIANKARSFIYSTALPPSACAAALASLGIIETNPDRLKQLWTNVQYLKTKIQALGFNILGSETPIIPILIGESKKTMKASKTLFENGIFVSGIRPPTVAEGEARLRITVNALHTTKEMEQLVHALQNNLKD
ncbi:MAG: 8-amino-7-oxononanoate synthase [Candidatus Saganbacteria bacterium]|nr:8-amino-7-oxononanoate synthase [Candidatus Saganbacteria bacterium]